MHMADALISAPVAIAAGLGAVALIGVAAHKSRENNREGQTAMMGVLGAFVFAAQMINFSIPGTGSSGHIIGGVLLAVLLGPWRGFLTICSVLIVQCLVFADGGLLALGCNIINMGAISCLVAYPFIYKPIVRHGMTVGRLMWASVLSCTIGLELGALMVSLETWTSGITTLPLADFLMFMLPIHLAIGLCEGVATGLVLSFVWKREPSMLIPDTETPITRKSGRKAVIALFLGVAVVFAVGFVWIASGNPDGLEWSIMKLTGSPDLAPALTPPTAFLPDYESHLSGIIGSAIVMVLLWALAAMLFKGRKAHANVR